MGFGIDSQFRYYEFEFDSDAADYTMNSSSTRLNWPLFKLGGKKPLENIAGIKILEAQIPFSWYIFNSYNNTFTFQESGFGPLTITIAEGNYTVTQLSTFLAAALTTASPNLLTYAVVFDSTTQKFTFWNNATTTTAFLFSFGAGDSNPRKMLGFEQGSLTSQGFTSTGSPKGNYLTSPYVVSLTGANYLYVNSAKMGNLTDIYLPISADSSTGGNAGPQMAKIPVNVQPGGTIYWADPVPDMIFDLESLNSLTEIDFYLTLGNSSQAPLDLNGQSFSLKMMVIVNEFNTSTRSGGLAANGRVMNRISKR